MPPLEVQYPLDRYSGKFILWRLINHDFPEEDVGHPGVEIRVEFVSPGFGFISGSMDLLGEV